MESVLLYHKGKTGALFSWRVWTEGPDVLTEYGQIDGLKQTSKKRVVAKNIGKANETSLDAQATKEAEAMFKHKLERKYALTPQEAEDPVYFPMLAHEFSKAKNVTYPIDIQPKLDGLRAFLKWEGDEVILMSRNGKTYDVKHITDFARDSGFVLKEDGREIDGEIYCHGMCLQDITALAKKPRPESIKLEFHAYDFPDPFSEDKPWEQRYVELCERFGNLLELGPLRLVETWRANTPEDKDRLVSEILEAGYEGAIARILSGPYLYGHRSRDLLKIKNFQDGEFKIIGAYEGVGRFEGCVTWIMETEEGLKFDCCPRGTLEQKKEMFRNKESYIGTYYKVKFFDRTKKGVPRFPIGLAPRLTEDM